MDGTMETNSEQGPQHPDYADKQMKLKQSPTTVFYSQRFFIQS